MKSTRNLLFKNPALLLTKKLAIKVALISVTIAAAAATLSYFVVTNNTNNRSLSNNKSYPVFKKESQAILPNEEDNKLSLTEAPTKVKRKVSNSNISTEKVKSNSIPRETVSEKTPQQVDLLYNGSDNEEAVLPAQSETKQSTLIEEVVTIDTLALVSEQKAEKPLLVDSIISQLEDSVNKELKPVFDLQALKQKFHISLNVMPAYSYRILLGKDVKYFNYHAYADFGLSTSLKLSYSINNMFSISTGCGYRMLQLASEQPLNDVSILVDDENLYFEGSFGSSDFELEDLQGNDGTLKTKASLHQLFIPLELQFNFFKNYFISTGLNYSYVFDSKVKAYIEQNSINSNLTSIQKNNLSFSIALGRKISINKNLNLLINSEFNINLNSSANNSFIESYPFLLGLNFGLQF